MLTFALRRGLEEELCKGFSADDALIRRTSDVNVYVGDNLVVCWSFWDTFFLVLGGAFESFQGVWSLGYRTFWGSWHVRG